jgi:sarcosine oxidase subunit gamma
MSNAVSALNGLTAAGDVTVKEAGLRGMITLRGDFSSRKFKNICTELSGMGFPEQGKANCDGDRGLCWMSPDEILLLVAHDDVAESLTKIEKALKGQHYLAANVSDARAQISVSGPFAREVIAKLAPADLHPDHFQPGDFRRTRLGQVAAAFWLTETGAIEIICFRSVADYTFRLLAASAKAGPVGYFTV